MKKDASPLIEAHILLGEEPFHWRLAAMADIEAIAAYIPLRLHQLAMQPGRFGGARKAGWACGDAPYLTWFDPDDRYPQKEAVDFFSRAACALDDTPNLAVVCSAEQQIDAEGRLFGRPQIAPPRPAEIRSRPSALHGLQLWRRSIVQSLSPGLQDTDPVAEWRLLLAALNAGHAYLRLPPIARLWRRHPRQLSRFVKIFKAG